MIKITAMGLLGEIAGSVLSGMSNIGSSIMANTQQEKQNKANLELAKYQFDQNKLMWDEQNRYNTPKMQMERFKAAGLNPNLIYGQGSSGNATQSVKYEAPTLQKSKVFPDLNVLSPYLDVKLKKAQIDNVNKQTEYLDNKNINEGLESALKNLLLNKNNIELRYLDSYLGGRSNIQFLQGQKLLGEGQLLKYNTDYRKKEVDAFSQLNLMRLGTLAQQMEATKQRTELTKKEIGAYDLGLIGKYAPGIMNAVRGIFK